MTTGYQYHVGTEEGFKIEMTCSLTLSTPTIQFSTILCHFQYSHMLGFIKLKINTKKKKKKQNKTKTKTKTKAKKQKRS